MLGLPYKACHLFFNEARFLVRSILLVVKGNKLCRSRSLFANQKKYSESWLDGMYASSPFQALPYEWLQFCNFTNDGLAKQNCGLLVAILLFRF